MGKTTTVLCLAKILLGSHLREGLLHLIMLNEHNLEKEIEMFASKRLALSPNQRKIIIINHVDNIPEKFQSELLQKIMQKYVKTICFALICNDSTKVIKPIRLNCKLHSFRRISNKLVVDKVESVCAKENLDFRTPGLKEIANISQGNLRTALNSL